jgi:hypothetical protein
MIKDDHIENEGLERPDEKIVCPSSDSQGDEAKCNDGICPWTPVDRGSTHSIGVNSSVDRDPENFDFK